MKTVGLMSEMQIRPEKVKGVIVRGMGEPKTKCLPSPPSLTHVVVHVVTLGFGDGGNVNVVQYNSRKFKTPVVTLKWATVKQSILGVKSSCVVSVWTVKFGLNAAVTSTPAAHAQSSGCVLSLRTSEVMLKSDVR